MILPPGRDKLATRPTPTGLLVAQLTLESQIAGKAGLDYFIRTGLAKPTMNSDDTLPRPSGDPVAQRFAATEQNVRSRRLDDGAPTHGFRTLLDELSTIVRDTCRVPGSTSTATFPMLTCANALQLRARELIDKIAV